MTNTETTQFDYIWDCREVSLGHSPKLKVQNGRLRALPNFAAQQSGIVAVTVCRECIPHLPGRMITMKTDSLETYFDIEDSETLFRELPDGFAASGASRKRRRKLIEYSMTDPYNPGQEHAGKTLQFAYAYQQNIDSLKPKELQ